MTEGGGRPAAAHELALVPHTHWDREWYLPFQAFRVRLVEMIDRVLDELEADPGFAFTLDGQLATVDDYLAIRPGQETRIRRLVAEGRLAVGPWLILMDEFLVGGETMVRNLRMGWTRAEELGAVMPVGYLPDMFGHVAQMPQLLRRAGIERAVVWRGVPAAIDRHRFRWLAPDGSGVVAEFLPDGYGNAAFLLDVTDPARVAERIDALDVLLRPYFGADTLLGMTGTDHTSPVARFMDRVARVNDGQDHWRIRVMTLRDYFAREAAEPVDESWQGELRSSRYANVLMGVTSARIDLKAAMSGAERRLARYAEPLGALWGGMRAPEPLLGVAWRHVVECSAHDSICGCSVDAVVDQVLVRLGEARQIADELTARAAVAAGRGLAPGDFVALNPSPEARQDVVELRAAIPDDWDRIDVELPGGSRLPAQEIGREPTLLLDEPMSQAAVHEFLLRVHQSELFGRYIRAWRIEPPDRGLPRRLEIEVDELIVPGRFEHGELVAAVEEALASDRAAAPAPGRWRVRVVAAPVRRFVAPVRAPALGWTGIRLVEAAPGDGGIERRVRVTGRTLDNGLVSLAVADDGAFRLERGGVALAGVGRLVDEGDYGDTYNWAPPRHDTVVDEPETTSVHVREAGPVRGVLAVERRYRWPVSVAPDGSERSNETAEETVATILELRAGEPFVRVRVAFDNACRDHRLRIHVPLPRRASASHAEGQFAVMERGLRAEGGHGETGLPTFPASGFVDAGGVAVLLDQVMEYELVGDGSALAITVLRATGLLSRDANPYRHDPAGPQLEIPGAQCRGPWRVSFALFPHGGEWHEAGVVAQAERFAHPFVVAPAAAEVPAAAGAPAPGPLPAPVEGLAVEGDGVVLAACRLDGDRLELRLVCESPLPQRATIRGPFASAREADLLGRAGGPLAVRDGRLSVDLDPWEVRSLFLALARPAGAWEPPRDEPAGISGTPGIPGTRA